MVYQRGKQKTWWFRFRFAGRIVHESSRSTSKTVARDAERQRRRQLEVSWNQITRRALPPTFERASREWIESRDGRLAPHTVSIGRQALKHLLPVFGSKLLCDISPRDVESYQSKRLREGAQGRTVNIELTALRQVMAANGMAQSLAGKVRTLPERRDLGRALTGDEEGRLIAAMDGQDSACRPRNSSQ